MGVVGSRKGASGGVGVGVSVGACRLAAQGWTKGRKGERGLGGEARGSEMEDRASGDGRRKADGRQTPHAYPRPSNDSRSVTHQTVKG